MLRDISYKFICGADGEVLLVFAVGHFGAVDYRPRKSGDIIPKKRSAIRGQGEIKTFSGNLQQFSIAVL